MFLKLAKILSRNITVLRTTLGKQVFYPWYVAGFKKKRNALRKTPSISSDANSFKKPFFLRQENELNVWGQSLNELRYYQTKYEKFDYELTKMSQSKKLFDQVIQHSRIVMQVYIFLYWLINIFWMLDLFGYYNQHLWLKDSIL